MNAESYLPSRYGPGCTPDRVLLLTLKLLPGEEKHLSHLVYNPHNNVACSENAPLAQPPPKMTGEHVWSDWMNALIPGQKIFHHQIGTAKQRAWLGSERDWKVQVVCGD